MFTSYEARSSSLNFLHRCRFVHAVHVGCMHALWLWWDPLVVESFSGNKVLDLAWSYLRWLTFWTRHLTCTCQWYIVEIGCGINELAGLHAFKNFTLPGESVTKNDLHMGTYLRHLNAVYLQRFQEPKHRRAGLAATIVSFVSLAATNDLNKRCVPERIRNMKGYERGAGMPIIHRIHTVKP